MRLELRSAFPFRSEDLRFDALIELPAHGVVALFHAVAAGGCSLALPRDAGRRGLEAFLRENPAPAPGESLGPLVDRVARAARQAGELAARGAAPEPIAAADGAHFAPDPKSHALGMGLEAAFVRVAGHVVTVAAVGRCAVLLLRGGTLLPLHGLHTLGSELPGAPDPLAHEIVTSTLGNDPHRLTGAMIERVVRCEPEDRLILASPAIAVPVVALGERPTDEAVAQDPEALIAWLLARIPPSGEAHEVQGLVAVITPG